MGLTTGETVLDLRSGAIGIVVGFFRRERDATLVRFADEIVEVPSVDLAPFDTAEGDDRQAG